MHAGLFVDMQQIIKNLLLEFVHYSQRYYLLSV